MQSASPSRRYYFSDEDDESQLQFGLSGDGGTPAPPPHGIEDDDRTKTSNSKKGKTSAGFHNKLRFWGKRIHYEESVDLSELQGIEIRRYSYMDLHNATQGFRREYVTSMGSSGIVYKAMLNVQQPAAIKVSSGTPESNMGCITEIKVMSQLRHRNLVRLLGWCHQAGQLAIVYEFVPNLTLFAHLYRAHTPLPWEVRFWRIVVGLASALLYLQEGLEKTVVHRDIEPSNILLDSDFTPKLGDFGLSRVVQSRGSGPRFPDALITAGTLGYLSPEILSTGRSDKESDIFAFGAVALAVATGRKAFDFSEEKRLRDWVEEFHATGRLLEAADPKLGRGFDEREMERLLLVGLWCTQRDPKSRPSIRLVLQLLNFEARMPSNFEDQSMVVDNPSDGYHDLPSPTPDTMLQPQSAATSASIAAYEVDELLSESAQDDEEEEEATPAATSEQEIFDIGIPLNFATVNRRKDHHRNIVKGYVDSLYEMMQSVDGLPRLDEALEEIRKYTGALVATVGPPLDDWNTLAQLVLRSLKEREDFFKSCEDQESLAHSATMLSLNTEIQKNVRMIREDEMKIEHAKERLGRAQQKCVDLAEELAEAREISLSIDAEIKAMEQRIAEDRVSLAQIRNYSTILKQYENILSKLSSFTC